MFQLKPLIAACAVTALLSGPVFAEQDTAPSAEQLAAEQAAAEKAAALLAITNNRGGTIDNLTASWGDVAEELILAVEDATNQQLLDMTADNSPEAARTILQGLPLGADGTATLGDISADLVFTPVVPCRFFDTRFDDGSHSNVHGGNPGTVLSYRTHSDLPGNPGGALASLVGQGGNPAGCPTPDAAEPSAIAANFTVVPGGTGHIRAWPVGSSQPTASFLNYKVGTNLANAGIIATCYLCGDDISVSTWFGSAESLGDVMGYFYPAVIPTNSIGMAELDSADLSNGTSEISQTLTSGPNYLMGSSFTPSASGRCLVSSTVQVNTSSADNGTAYIRTVRQAGAASPTEDFVYGQYITSTGDSYSTSVTAHYQWDVSGGTSYKFGCLAGYPSSDIQGNTAHCRTSWMCF